MFNKKTSQENFFANALLLFSLIIISSSIHASVASDIPYTRTDRNDILPYNWISSDVFTVPDAKEQDIEYVGSCMWSQVTDVFSAGSDLWASFNNGLCHIDISDISNPVVVSELYIPCGSKGITGTNDIIVENSYAYIGDKDGLRIVDINNMELVSTYPLQRAHTLFLCDTILYVADGTGVKVFNVTNPAIPDSIGFYPIPGAVGIDIDSYYAYISDTGGMGLTILDITIPDNPVFVSNYNTPGYGNNVAFSNGHAFIADHNNGLEIVDVTDPLNPVLKSNIQTSGSAYDVKVAGNYAFVAADNMDVIDISNLSTPFIAQTFPSMDDVRSIFLSGDYLFSSEGSFLEILNIQQPTNTYLEGSLERPYWLQEVRIGEGIAYIADMGEIYLVPGGLKIVDISDQENPFLQGEYSMDLWAIPNNLDIKDSYVYMQDYISSTYKLIALDVSNPDMPQLAGEYPYTAKDIFTGDSYVYVLDSDKLRIFDLQDPSNPILEGSLTLSDDALRICVNNGYAFIAGNGVNTLWIVDVSDCSNPQLITSITTACNYARDIVVQDSLLYLVCTQHMQIINIDDINNPAIISTFDEVNSATGICVANNYAYIADNNLLKIDISDPAAPSFVEAYPIPGCAYNVAVFDKYLFVTTESSFLIFQDSDLLHIAAEDEFLQMGTALIQNYPNPFNMQTTIEYHLPVSTRITLNIYDLQGRKLRMLVNDVQFAGSYSVVWDGKDSLGECACTGVYYYMLELDNAYIQSGKLLLIR
ncbi:MAG: T9SS type A sorting domain-containing protein [Candidatus Aegiribacteria sp.]|nr:T9SS type A sorting domain-containing protein [Candidatus Aegiribacteria sp.]